MVAERAGVSPMTVSNLLRDRTDQMGEETRLRVLQAIHDLEYIPVRTAAQNRHVRTNAIGVVFLQDMQGAVGYPTFQGMCDRARQTDHDLTIFLRSKPDWVKPGTEGQFLDRRCDGFIFVGDNRPEVSEVLVQHGIPVVECYSFAPPAGVARVLGDNASAMRQVVAHLVAQGHRRIAHIAGPEDKREAVERRESFCAAMREMVGPGADGLVLRANSWGDLWGFGEGDPGAPSDGGRLRQRFARAGRVADGRGTRPARPAGPVHHRHGQHRAGGAPGPDQRGSAVRADRSSRRGRGSVASERR